MSNGPTHTLAAACPGGITSIKRMGSDTELAHMGKSPITGEWWESCHCEKTK